MGDECTVHEQTQKDVIFKDLDMPLSTSPALYDTLHAYSTV